MRLQKIISVMVLLCLFMGIIIPVSSGAETITQKSGWYEINSTIEINDRYINLVSLNESAVNLTINKSFIDEIDCTLFLDNRAYTYNDLIWIYLNEINSTDKKAKLVIYVKSPPSDSNTPGQPTGTRLSCDIPAQLALGGDVVIFPITIQNNENGDRTYSLSASSDTNWDIRFTSGDKGIYKIFVPKSQSKVINLEIQTNGNTPVGEKKITAYVDNHYLDLYVDITSINQSAEVISKYTSKIASIGDKINYDLRIKNLQSKENIYKLSVTGLPENWYYLYKETASSTEEMAEVIVPASTDKDLVLEIVPPYTIKEGEYNFTAIITSPDGTIIKKDLTLILKSGFEMSLISSKLAYESKPGEAFDIDIYVRNSGKGAALTNVFIETEAPEGWMIEVSPNRTNSIKAGETQVFKLSVMPPGNIVASEYGINVKVKSDQAVKEKDYKITIKTESYIPFIGGAIILFVLAGLVFMYRKYGRR